MSLKNYSDEEMILLLQSNDEVALWLIFDNYWESLFLSAFNIVKDRFLAEDIVQETIITVWDKRMELNITHSLKAYLFASVRYSSYKQWKKLVDREGESLDEVQLVDNHSPFEVLAYNDLKNKIDIVVNDLPNRCKEVYLLSREDQLSHKEIAERMNISTKTVESQLTKAIRRLRLSIDNLSVIIIFIHLIK
jgi:RNA polymerase sigma-70 factor (ECF subfamily)